MRGQLGALRPGDEAWAHGVTLPDQPSVRRSRPRGCARSRARRGWRQRARGAFDERGYGVRPRQRRRGDRAARCAGERDLGCDERAPAGGGIGGPMRVLDLGTELAHVAFQVADRPRSRRLGGRRRPARAGCSRSPRAGARPRASRTSASSRGTRAPSSGSEPFDAIVARLLVFHLPDREAVVRRQLDALLPGGTMVLVEFDIGVMCSEPEEAARRGSAHAWIEAAFRSAGAYPRIGAKRGSCCAGRDWRTSRRSGSSSTSAPTIRPGRACARASSARWPRRSSRGGSPTRRSWGSTCSRRGSSRRSSPTTRSSCRLPSWARGSGAGRHGVSAAAAPLVSSRARRLSRIAVPTRPAARRRAAAWLVSPAAAAASRTTAVLARSFCETAAKTTGGSPGRGSAARPWRGGRRPRRRRWR